MSPRNSGFLSVLKKWYRTASVCTDNFALSSELLKKLLNELSQLSFQILTCVDVWFKCTDV